MEPGTLYFHLNLLMTGSNFLIKKDERKKYVLTPLGKLAYKLLTEMEDKITWITSRETSKTSKPLIMIGEILGFKQILQLAYRASNTYIFNAVILAVLYGIVSYYSNKTPFILMVIPYRLPLMQTVVLAAFSWIITFAASEFLSKGIYKKSENKSKLLIGVTFSLIPLMISMLMNILVKTFNVPKNSGNKFDCINLFYFIGSIGVMDINVCNRLSKRPKTHQSSINNRLHKSNTTAIFQVKT